MKRSFCLTIGLLGAGAIGFSAIGTNDDARAASPVIVSTAAAAPNPGKALFMRCTACHAESAKGPKKMGPHLGGIVGRKAAAVDGFRYSPAMKKSTVVWDRARLDAFLKRPSAVVPGTSMAFAGISDAKQRAALIDYLDTLD